MAITKYTKNKAGDFDLEQLQQAINVDNNVVPSCVKVASKQVSENSFDISFDFMSPLNVDEEARLEQLLNEHTPSAPAVPLTLLPFSPIDGKKLAVHQSTKPQIDGITTYAVWGGAGDNGTIGDGDLLDFEMTPGNATVSKVVEYMPVNGRVWVHEGYLKFEGGGHGDYINADIVSKAVVLQQSVNLDLVVADNWISYAPGGPGTGTHGFADANIVLIPRPYSKDGDWNYDGVSLTPNMAGTGEYKMSDIERIVHRYFNKIPCCGTCSAFFSMTSNETTEMPPGYFMRITAHNNSDTTWSAQIIMEIYRERTHIP